MINAIIVRQYPLLFSENKGENNNSASYNTSFLTEAQESKRQKEYDDKRQGLIEKVVEKAEKEAYEVSFKWFQFIAFPLLSILMSPFHASFANY